MSYEQRLMISSMNLLSYWYWFDKKHMGDIFFERANYSFLFTLVYSGKLTLESEVVYEVIEKESFILDIIGIWCIFAILEYAEISDIISKMEIDSFKFHLDIKANEFVIEYYKAMFSTCFGLCGNSDAWIDKYIVVINPDGQRQNIKVVIFGVRFGFFNWLKFIILTIFSFGFYYPIGIMEYHRDIKKKTKIGDSHLQFDCETDIGDYTGILFLFYARIITLGILDYYLQKPFAKYIDTNTELVSNENGYSRLINV